METQECPRAISPPLVHYRVEHDRSARVGCWRIHGWMSVPGVLFDEPEAASALQDKFVKLIRWKPASYLSFKPSPSSSLSLVFRRLRFRSTGSTVSPWMRRECHGIRSLPEERFWRVEAAACQLGCRQVRGKSLELNGSRNLAVEMESLGVVCEGGKMSRSCLRDIPAFR